MPVPCSPRLRHSPAWNDSDEITLMSLLRYYDETFIHSLATFRQKSSGRLGNSSLASALLTPFPEMDPIIRTRG